LSYSLEQLCDLEVDPGQVFVSIHSQAQRTLLNLLTPFSFPGIDENKPHLIGEPNGFTNISPLSLSKWNYFMSYMEDLYQKVYSLIYLRLPLQNTKRNGRILVGLEGI